MAATALRNSLATIVEMAEPGAQLDIHPTSTGWRLVGEIDAHTAPALSRALATSAEAAGEGDVPVIDLAEVSFMDSSGLRVLVEATRAARDRGSDLELASPQPALSRLFEIAGLTELLRITS